MTSGAERYDAWFQTPLGAAVDAAEAAAVMGLARPQAGERALDAGCGTGLYTRRLLAAGLDVTAVDTDREMLAAARPKASDAHITEGDVTALRFADDSFDLTIAVTVLCFVPEPAQAVSELVRVTRPGGRVVLAELNRWSLWAAHRRLKGWRGDETWRAAQFFTPAELASMLRAAGAAAITTTAAAYLPPGAPGPLVRRVRGSSGGCGHFGLSGRRCRRARRSRRVTSAGHRAVEGRVAAAVTRVRLRLQRRAAGRAPR